MVKISIVVKYSYRVNRKRKPHGTRMYRSTCVRLGISDIQLTSVTLLNYWTVLCPIYHSSGLTSAGCRAKLRQGVFKLVFLSVLSDRSSVNSILAILASAMFLLASSLSWRTSSSCSVWRSCSLSWSCCSCSWSLWSRSWWRCIFYLAKAAAFPAKTFRVRSFVFV